MNKKAPIVPDPAANLHLSLARQADISDGIRAQLSFLLAVIADESKSDGDRAVALLQMLDGADSFTRVLDARELAEFKQIVSTAFDPARHHSYWSEQALPDESFHAVESIDGNNVRRLIVGPSSESEIVTPVASREAPSKQKVAVISELTHLGEGVARVRVVESGTGAILGSSTVPKGLHVVCEIIVDLSDRVESTLLSVELTSSTEIMWYRTTFLAVAPDEPPEPLSRRMSERVVSARTALPRSVFTPTTGEPLLLRDVERLMSLRNKFKGERIFVMGNGPSLRRTPLDMLQDEFVFGVNRISLLFDQVSWRPQFFTAFDVRVVPDNQQEFAELDIEYKFFSARYKELMGERESHYWYHTKGFYDGFGASFEATVPYSGFGGGGTIGVMAVELAFYMGFRDIYLIGTDVSYSVPKSVKQSGEDEFGDGVKLRLESTEDDDHNHFDPRYFGKNKKWHNPNVREMKIGFGRAASYVAQRGGRLRNATVGGELEEVERVDFSSLFSARSR